MTTLKSPEYPKHGHSDEIVLELYKYHSVQSIYENFTCVENVFAQFLSSVQAQFVLNLKFYRALLPDFDKETKVSGLK